MTPVFYSSSVVRFSSMLWMLLMCQMATAEMQSITNETKIDAVGSISVKDMLPPDMVDERIGPMMEVNGQSVSLAFSDNRPLEKRSITVYFSNSAVEMERFSG